MPGPESLPLIGSPDENHSLIQASIAEDEIRVWASGFSCILSAICGQGKWLVAFDSYETIHVYEVATETLLHTIRTPAGPRQSDLCGSITCPQILVRFTDGSMSLIDALSDEVVQRFSDPEGGESANVLGCSFTCSTVWQR